MVRCDRSEVILFYFRDRSGNVIEKWNDVCEHLNPFVFGFVMKREGVSKVL